MPELKRTTVLETESSAKRQEVDQRKPGRKPIETEAKNKRTAQNRAAQRAFRERKEKKMKELEDQVAALESAKKQTETEADFLKAQVDLLMSELRKAKGDDYQMPQLDSLKGRNPNVSNSRLMGMGSVPSSVTPVSVKSEHGSGFTFEFPWNGNRSDTSTTPSSTNKSPNSTMSSPPDLFNPHHDSSTQLPLFSTIDESKEFDFDAQFDEGRFCSKMGEACGTRLNPVPSTAGTPTAGMTPAATVAPVVTMSSLLKPDIGKPFTEFTTISRPVEHTNELENLFQDPLDLLPDIDPSMAFTTDNVFSQFLADNDPIAGLTTEESLYDAFSPRLKKDVDEDEDDDDEVVPNNDTKLMECTEVWDRISAHPKYTELDIDGLCAELRSKAKCSDKGVVVSCDDFIKTLETNVLN